MKSVFADTSYYIALLSPGDSCHVKAVELSHTLRQPVVVTEFILLELANALSHVNARQLFISLLPHLKSNPNVVVVPASPELFERGYSLYSHRADKNWSLTDCISFVVMEEYGLNDALTTDHHFEQAGFQMLPR